MPNIIRDPKYKGEYIKVGNWYRLLDIDTAIEASDAQGSKVTLALKDGRTIVYRGSKVSQIAKKLKDKGVKDK